MELKNTPYLDWQFSHGSIVRRKDGQDICLFIPDLEMDVRIRLVNSYRKKDGAPWYDDKCFKFRNYLCFPCLIQSRISNL